MSTPPFGVGYPDGSAMVSAWGPKLYDEQTQVHPNGATLVPRTFVGNWKFLVCHVIVGAGGGVELDFLWDANNVFALGVGAADVHLSSADTSEVYLTLPNLGPYVTVSLAVTGGGNATLSGSIVPADNLVGAVAGYTTGQVLTLSGTLAAGANLALPLPTISARRGTLCVETNLGPALAVLLSNDRSGTRRGIQAISTPTQSAGSQGNTAGVIIPAMRNTLQIFNTHSAAQNVLSALIADPG